MATQRSLSKQLVVRVDGELLEHLKRDADANGRTVAQSVRFILNKQVRAAV